MKSERKFHIELYEESDSVNFYTIHFEDEENTEFDRFLLEFTTNPKFQKDLQIIARWIDKIGEKGASENRFRPESKMTDGVNAIPIEVSKLRLYCLRISDSILILGNGGYKPKAQHNYNSDSKLNSCVDLLSKLDRYLKVRIANGSIHISGRTISGNMTFYYK